MGLSTPLRKNYKKFPKKGEKTQQFGPKTVKTVDPESGYDMKL